LSSPAPLPLGDHLAFNLPTTLPWQSDASRLIDAGWNVSVVTFPRKDLGFRYIVAAQKEGERVVAHAESLPVGFSELAARVLGRAEAG
jgi:hypothetical protein